MAKSRAAGHGGNVDAQSDLTARVLASLVRVTGSDFSDFRGTTLQRRLARRMGLLGVDSHEEYLALLESDDDEVRALFRDILINVTGFFREPEAFDALKEVAFPEIISRNDPEGIRFWVPGCSTGEEPYSLAIAISEALDEAGAPRHVQIFATDINEAQVVKARAATYTDEISSSVSPERLDRYFDRVPAGWRVRKQIREMCVFAHHDLTRDPPFTRIDMVSCRNLLIYWNRAQQERIIPLFHYSLRPQGFLLLGASESAARSPELFEPLGRAGRLYRRRDATVTPRVRFGTYGTDRLGPRESRSLPGSADEDVSVAERLVAEENPMSAVLVDERLESVYFWGRTAPYFLPHGGEASLGLARSVAHDLLPDVMSAIDEVRESAQSAWRGPLVLENGQRVFLHVVPISGGREKSVFLVLIGEQGEEARHPTATSAPPGMKLELDTARQQLLAKVEELTVANEELRTAEEQVRDTNSELLRVTHAQEEQNAHLRDVRDELANVLSSADLPIVVLDREGRIRTSTAAAASLLGVRPDDVGRPFSDLASVGRFTGLGEIVSGLTAQDPAGEHPVVDRGGQAWVLRTSLFLLEGRAPDGFVLAFLDVEQSRRRALEESLRLMTALTAIDLMMSSVLDADVAMRRAGEMACTVLGADSAALYSREGGNWTVIGGVGLGEDAVGTRFDDGDQPYLVHERIQDVWLIDDVQTNEHMRNSLQRKNKDRSIVAIQLAAREEVAGAIVFGFRSGVRFSDVALEFVRGLGASGSVALENARLYRAQLNVAERLQQALLELPADVRGIDFAAHYAAARDEAAVGGDFYDVFEMGGDLVALVVGDVSGKGLDAAVLTALARNALRAHALEARDPADAFMKLNRLVYRFTPPEMYLTAFFGILDVKSGALTYSSAGHPPAIIVHPDGPQLLECIDPILGATEHLEYEACATNLGKRDTLLLYTDGITEARAQGELFGTDRLLAVVEGVSRSKPDQLLAAVMDETLSFACGHLQDDVALLAVRRSTRKDLG